MPVECIHVTGAMYVNAPCLSRVNSQGREYGAPHNGGRSSWIPLPVSLCKMLPRSPPSGMHSPPGYVVHGPSIPQKDLWRLRKAETASCHPASPWRNRSMTRAPVPVSKTRPFSAIVISKPCGYFLLHERVFGPQSACS